MPLPTCRLKWCTVASAHPRKSIPSRRRRQDRVACGRLFVSFRSTAVVLSWQDGHGEAGRATWGRMVGGGIKGAVVALGWRSGSLSEQGAIQRSGRGNDGTVYAMSGHCPSASAMWSNIGRTASRPQPAYRNVQHICTVQASCAVSPPSVKSRSRVGANMDGSGTKEW